MRYFRIFFWPKSNPYMPLVNFRKKNSLPFLRFSPEFRSSNIYAVTDHTRNQIFFERYPKIFFLQNLHYVPFRSVPRRFFQILIFYSRNLHFNKGFLRHFRKLLYAHAEHTRKRFYLMLSILGTDFFANWAYEEWISAHAQPAVKCELFYMYNLCWAYAERILSHTEHTQNEFHRMLSILITDLIACWACAEMFKSRISLPIRIRFLKISCYRPLGPYGFGFRKKSHKKNFMLVYL
jgi:hypothetical protein